MANQIVLQDEFSQTLQSYDTKVVRKTFQKVALDPKWNVSATTTRAVCAFLDAPSRKAVEKMIEQGIYVIENLND